MRAPEHQLTVRRYGRAAFAYHYPTRALSLLSGEEAGLLEDIGRGKRVERLSRGAIASLFRLSRLGLIELADEDMAALVRAIVSGATADDADEVGPAPASSDAWSILWQEAAASHALVKTHFELTHGCNLACLHCYNPATRQVGLPTPWILDVLRQIRAQHGLFITFTGGEPFVAKAFPTILRQARDLGLVISVSSNGTLIDERWCERLRAAEIFSLDISIYGLSAETYARVTGKGEAFAAVRRSLARLAEHQVPTTLKYILTARNAHEASRFAGFLRDVGMRGLVHIPRLFPRQDGDVSPWSCDLSDDEYGRLFQAGIMDVPRNRGRCHAGTSRIRISPEGVVFPCEFLPIRMGDLAQQPLEQILAAAGREGRFSGGAIHSPRECRSCKVRPFCMRCPAMSYAESGELTRAAPRACRVARLADRATAAARGAGAARLQ